METKLVVVMRNDKNKNEIKPILIVDSIVKARKIVEKLKDLARLTKSGIEYYMEYTPIIENPII